jgi:hypothetical protein
MKKLRMLISKWAIRIFGDVQFFPYPFFCLLWGNTHYRVKGSEVRRLIELLKEGDVILRRYDRYVSAWFIPGFWTHVGLMATDKTVIHATTKGVIEEDILTFLRADHVMVLRFQDEEAAQKAASMSRSLLGRDYDFLFDASDDTRLYCSELIKHCYPGVFDELGTGMIPPDKLVIDKLEELHESKKFRAGDYNKEK